MKSSKVRVIDGLAIAQAGKNESHEKRYQLRVVGLNIEGGGYEN
jgi:hypothetical protein